jgi:hypothetical protein
MEKEKKYNERKEDLATGYIAENLSMVRKEKRKYDEKR